MKTRKLLYFTVIALLFGNIVVFWAAYRLDHRPLIVAFLDVGQGDSIFIESPTGSQILIDAGPVSNKVLTTLGVVMPIYDKNLDLVIVTHPDADHIGGFPAVLERYDVSAVMQSGVVQKNPTKIYQTLENKIIEKHLQTILARRGQRLLLGGGATLDILFPDRDVSKVTNTNDGSVVAKLTYGKDTFLFTADAPNKIEQILLGYRPNELQSEVLKVGHHGARTSTGQSFLEAVAPTYAIISAGKNNSYGHPFLEVIERLTIAGITVFSTIDKGTIIFKSDGKGVDIK